MSDWRQCLSVDINLRKLMTFDASTIICTKGIRSKLRVHQYPRLIPSMDPWVTFDRYLIDTLVDTQYTFDQHLGLESTNFDRHAIECRSTHELVNTYQLLTDCQSIADQVSIEEWLIVDSVLAKHPLKCWLRVSQGYQSQKPSVAKTFHSLALISLSL